MVKFKRALKQLSVPVTDPEIKELFEYGIQKTKSLEGQLEIADFVKLVQEAQRSKPLPAYINVSAQPGQKARSRIGMGS